MNLRRFGRSARGSHDPIIATATGHSRPSSSSSCYVSLLAPCKGRNSVEVSHLSLTHRGPPQPQQPQGAYSQNFGSLAIASSGERSRVKRSSSMCAGAAQRQLVHGLRRSGGRGRSVRLVPPMVAPRLRPVSLPRSSAPRPAGRAGVKDAANSGGPCRCGGRSTFCVGRPGRSVTGQEVRESPVATQRYRLRHRIQRALLTPTSAR